MKIYTAHIRQGREPVLLREGFSLWAALLGPVWLLANRAWLPGLSVLVLYGLAIAFVPQAARAPLQAAASVLMGLLGRDMLRWSLERRGYALAHVVAAQEADVAWGRLLSVRPDLLDGAVARLK